MLASLPVAMASGDYKSGGMDRYSGEKSKSAMIDGVYLVMAKPDQAQVSDNKHSFYITEIAIMGKEGKGAVFSFDKPLQGLYDGSDDMGYISTVNFKAAQVRMNSADKLALSTSDAKAIVKLEGIKPLYKGDDYSLMEFSEVYMMKPDGQMQEYELAKPVTIVYSRDRNLAVIDAYPTFTESLMKGSADAMEKSFSSDRMTLDELMSKEESAKENKVPYESPAKVRSPAREIGGGK
ncbi:MAG: hypothetical protein A4E28_01230 [Methanocella sp. PtaU1.Bin125]|nr:MAG: hypothetical protein A4E28_01230 [Methanocella sp. PtaU1.Bin125]